MALDAAAMENAFRMLSFLYKISEVWCFHCCYVPPSRGLRKD